MKTVPFIRKFYFILFCILIVPHLSAQIDEAKSTSVFPIDPLAPPSKYRQVAIRDYAFIIEENNTYSFTVDFIRRIKGAYYIGAHTIVLDSTIYVKILEPLIYEHDTNERIQVGHSYDMRLKRYFPNPLSHTIDYYVNYNFLFGRRIVSLQSTDCLSYIFSTDDLVGLHYINKNDSRHKSPTRSEQDDEIAYSTFLSIIRKNKYTSEQFVNRLSVVSCAKKQAKKYSLVNHKKIHCIPPFSLKTRRQNFNEDTKGLNMSEKLYYLIMDGCFNYYKYDESDLLSSISVNKLDKIYQDKLYITYRILWTTSLIDRNFCTYLSFKRCKGNMKLIGICSSLY